MRARPELAERAPSRDYGRFSKRARRPDLDSTIRRGLAGFHLLVDPAEADKARARRGE